MSEVTHHVDATTGKPRPPANVHIAFLLWIGFNIILILLMIILWNLPEPPDGRPQMPEEWRNRPGQRMNDALVFTGKIAALLMFISIPIGITIGAIRMRKGSNMARITLAVIGSVLAFLILVNIVTNLSSLPPIGAYFMMRLLMSLIMLTLLTGAITLMFRPRVSGFFR